MTHKPTQLDLEACGPDLAGYMQHLANQPLRPARPQEPCDVGMFSDAPAQIDLIDYLTTHTARE